MLLHLTAAPRLPNPPPVLASCMYRRMLTHSLLRAAFHSSRTGLRPGGFLPAQ
jgi:hypothetical protein